MLEQLKDSGLLKTQAFINGEWVNADNGDQFSVFNPGNGEKLVDVVCVGVNETRRAIVSAEQAMQQWKEKPAAQRSAVLEKWHALMIEHQADLATIMSFEQGKPMFESVGEVNYGASYLKWFAEEGKRVYGDVIPSAQNNRRGIVIKQAVGVVGAITPWNFPNAMIARKVAPAIAAGCAIVLKPAAETPLSALAMAELAQRAGLPKGLFSVLPSTKAAEVGGEITANTIVKKLTFTGSTPVGKLLMKQCAETVKRTSMELGGNAPLIIFDDANLDSAVEGALLSKFRNSGQTCICANRIMVQAGTYDAFMEKFSAAVKAFRLGEGFDQGTTHGPVISQKALNNIDRKVARAIEQGATVVAGGKVASRIGNFYQPTILANLNSDMDIFSEEIFGPVAAVFKFDTQEQAIAMANDTPFGLAAYFYSQNISRVWQVSEALEYGMVGVNETAISAETIPFGGVKESGQGREGSKYGLDDYLETKYICMGGL